MKNNSKWKRICSGILAVGLVVALLLSNQSVGVFAEENSTEAGNEEMQENTKEVNGFNGADKSEEGTQESDNLEIEENNGFYAEEDGKEASKGGLEEKFTLGEEENDAVVQSEDETGVITFDLAKGKVVFQADNTYIGYDAKGNPITGEHKKSNVYEITQSGSESTDNTIVIETANMYGQDISIKNQESTYNITLNHVRIDCSSKQHIPADGMCEGVEITSHYYRTLEQQLRYYQDNQICSPILAGDDTVSVNVTLVGKNELYAQPGAGATLQYAHYPMGEVGDGALTINGDGELVVTQSVSGSVNRGACIGGPMLYVSGSKKRTGNGKLVFKGGRISVETDQNSYSAAIGGGSCSPVEKPIIFCGSAVTAKSFNTSAAIGAGGGSSGIGENAGDIKIESGNITVYSSESGVGIGAGSSEWRSGGEAKNIEISGGEVTVYGADNSSYGKIGGGTSRNLGKEVEERSGGAANITISGGKVVAGTIGGGNTDAEDAKGGNAVIQVKDDANITTESIGGGEAMTGKGGNAEVIISGGNLNVQKTIGGGNSNSGNGGDASIYVSGGTLDCASIGGGNSVSGTPGSVTSATQVAGVVVTGGTLKTGTIGGGTNESGEIGFATADISNGNIQGQFILSNTDQTRKCFFHMTGGTIDNQDLGTDKYLKAQTNGGAVYLTDENGEVNISGGTIQNAAAELGGAVYMTKGSFTLSGNATIQNCTARGNSDNNTFARGGAVYLENGSVMMTGGCILSSSAAQGGAVYLNNGTVTLSNGTIGKENSANSAEEGAGIYVAGGTLIVNGTSIAYNNAKNGAGAYLNSGNMEISNGQILHNISSENGAGAYLAGGTLNVSGGIITENTATKNGGGIFLSSGNMTLSGGRIYSNLAVNGAGAYLNGGNLTVSGGGDFDSNTASADGGGAYLAGGALTVDSGAFNNNKASSSGGGAYLAGGTLTINGGAFGNNTATNGGGAYVADGKVRMFGGYITNNNAKQSGGGFYVSSDKQVADVVIRSGTISGNKAGEAGTTSNQGNGGAIAVISNGTTANRDHVVIGLRHQHPDLDLTTRKFTSFGYTDSIDSTEHTHESCPTIKDNEATGNGGGIYMASSTSILDIYCLLEENNKADADATGGSLMSVGGNVNIGDAGDDGNGNNTSNAVGNILIKSKMLVKGGAVKIYGNTDNPKFLDQILVDIQKNAGSFEDYRFTQMTDDVNYKIEYFENFFRSGMFTAIQYKESDEIPSMGTMYVHEGYKIVGWAKTPDATIPDYTTESGTLIGSKGHHEAWDNLGDSGALKLYAIWQKISYIVEYHVNVNDGQYSGKMSNDTFTYGEKKALTSNAYKVKGKRFLNWNTESNGTGTSYDEAYDESKMISKDGDTVKLYAQWVDCTHHGGAHDGILSYSLNTNRDTITETCDCGNYSAMLKISGADVYYDGATHPATLAGELYENRPQITYMYKTTSTENYGTMPEGETIPTREGYYKASITVGKKTASVEYQIKSAASAATIDVTTKKGEHFTDMNGESTCTVAQDDAFTIQYQVHALNTGVNDAGQKGYITEPILILSQELPAGTTIIMQTGGKYWYNNHPTGTEISLTSFTQMGGTDSFAYDTEVSTIDDEQSYRFIVDFSQVQNGAYIVSGKKVEIGLKYAYTNPQTGKPETSQDKESKASITIDSKVDFGITVSSDKKNQVTVTAPSNSEDTRWNQKNLVWKIKAEGSMEKLPLDAKITLTTEENGSIKTVISSLNQNGEFTIPFDWTDNKEFTFSLDSDQESVADKTYTLTAALYVGSQSQEVSYPLACEDNLQKASGSVMLTIPVSKKPSLKISSTQKVLSKSETLKVNVVYHNIDISDCSITGVIRKKDQDGKYNESSNLGQKTITGEGVQDISLASTNGAGSYCLWVTVSKNNQTILEVPYYFIIQE